MGAVMLVPQDMFDTVAGLPVHVLAVHAVVAGVPLLALATVLVAARPRWRARFGWYVVAADLALVAVVWFTTRAGHALQARLGGQVALEHGRLGDRMPWFALALAGAAVLAALVGRRRGALGLLAVAAVAVTAAASVVWVVLTGHSGSAAVWEGIVRSTSSTR
jgi:hypothetical protein